MSNRIVLELAGRTWRQEGSPSGLMPFALLELKVKLTDLMAEVDAQLDFRSADWAMRQEFSRRMNGLAERAQAAGMMSEMWTNTKNRFYKERVAIESMRGK